MTDIHKYLLNGYEDAECCYGLLYTPYILPCLHCLNVSKSASGRVKVLSMFPHLLEGTLKKAMPLPILAMILLIFHGGRAGLGLTN